MHTCSRLDFIETDLRPSMLESFVSHMEWVERMHTHLNRYVDRLDVVRKKQDNARLELINGKPVHNLRITMFYMFVLLWHDKLLLFYFLE